MELQPLKVRFYPKKRSKGSKTYTLYMRMVLKGKRTDFALNYELKRDAWDDKEQTLKSKHPQRSYVLNLTNKYRQKAFSVYEQLIQRGSAYDVNIIREKVTGTEKDHTGQEPTLMRLFTRSVDRKKALAGKDNCERTIQKYNRCKKHLAEFLEAQYGTDDIRFNHITLQFVEDFEVHLKTEGKCCHNTTMKHIQTFKTIYRTATAHGYTDRDPFQKYRIRMEEVGASLTEQEIQTLIKLELPSEKLETVRDLFLFSCFTGLAYVDLKGLCAKHIHFENGRYWIRSRRQKTECKNQRTSFKDTGRIDSAILPGF